MDYGQAALVLEQELGRATPAYTLLRVRDMLVNPDSLAWSEAVKAVQVIARELGRAI